MCNKVSYKTKQDALVDARHIKNSKYRMDAAKKLRPYVCLICGYYHLTSRKPFKQSKMRVKK